MPNRLSFEKSPYLLQHKDNPVDWYPWSGEAFRKAAEEEKPILLSIGYSTCHWCHVMAHESFEDEEVADILNHGYVCIKLDREERPDIDAVYMSVCQAMTGSGGWPLTIIMTPEQKPFFAGTYFPRDSCYGRPGLKDILRQILVLWNHQRSQLLQSSEQITAAIQPERPAGRSTPSRSLLERACHMLQNQFDPQWGGFGDAPKFPSPHNLLFLMEYSRREALPLALSMAELTLEKMADGGIHDQIGGGFSRYSTDEAWLIPHFEKMLYDNALLILAYLEAFCITQKSGYKDIVHRTAGYILRELMDEQGGFYCGQDADSDGIEGSYYVFTPREITQVLGEKDGKAFCHQYGISEAGNFEGKNIPNRIGLTGPGWRPKDPRLKQLYLYRKKRAALHRDHKILLSWNAWAITALARTGACLGEPSYLEAAKKAHRFIRSHMAREETSQRLYLRFCDGEAAHEGQLEDYGVYALALLTLYQATFQPEYLEEAILRAEQCIALFEDIKAGGYYLNASDAAPLIARPKEVYDGALPSGNSVMAMVLQRLAFLTGESKWQQAAKRQMEYCAFEIQDYPAGSSFALLAMAEALYPHRELICVSRAGIPEELMLPQSSILLRDASVLVKTAENASQLEKCVPFSAAYPLPQEGCLYYLCENGTCRAPVSQLSQSILS